MKYLVRSLYFPFPVQGLDADFNCLERPQPALGQRRPQQNLNDQADDFDNNHDFDQQQEDFGDDEEEQEQEEGKQEGDFDEEIIDQQPQPQPQMVFGQHDEEEEEENIDMHDILGRQIDEGGGRGELRDGQEGNLDDTIGARSR